MQELKNLWKFQDAITEREVWRETFHWPSVATTNLSPKRQIRRNAVQLGTYSEGSGRPRTVVTIYNEESVARALERPPHKLTDAGWVGDPTKIPGSPNEITGTHSHTNYQPRLLQHLVPWYAVQDMTMANFDHWIFQQDGVSRHYAMLVRKFWIQHSPGCGLIGRRGSIKWPRSPDSTP